MTEQEFNNRIDLIYDQLMQHEITQSFFSCEGIKFDGEHLELASSFHMPGLGSLSAQQIVFLFSVFNGSRIHVQPIKHLTVDQAPPGLYFNIINTKVIQNSHKNRIGLVFEENEAPELYVDSLHIDHFYLHEQHTRAKLGTLAFTLCAITAYRVNIKSITLIAAGGVGFNPNYIGYKVWPKLGFNAELLPNEVDHVAELAACQTVQQVIEINSDWWDVNGSQRLMTFDLSPNSISWKKLLSYTEQALILGNRP